MTILRAIKNLLTIVAGGTVYASFLLLLAAAVLVLFVIPGGLGILTLELERLKRGLRRSFAFLVRAKSESRPESV